MTCTRFAAAGCAILTAILLVGCGRSSPAQDTAAPPSSASTAIVAAAASIAPAPTAASSAPLPGDHVSTARYKIAIEFPTLPPADAPLLRALQENSVAAKREFMQGLPDPKEFPQFADRQLQLLINYTIAARTPAFVSVREKGMADTGGAHPIPIDASFVYDTHAQRVIGLDDLFSDAAQAHQRFSDAARKALGSTLLVQAPDAGEGSPEARREWTTNMQKMIDDGTDPNGSNFTEFILDAGADGKSSGITLLFPPYQVAPYVYGTQTVDLPVKVFADLLKPGYRDAFGDAGE